MQLIALLLMIPSLAFGAVQGKLTLNSTTRGFILRDAQNGQWRGGYSKPLFSMLWNEKEMLYIGYAHTWNAEHGNPALGLNAGKHVAIADIAASVESILKLPDVKAPPFLGYIGKIISLTGNVSYMPVHTADVRGPVIWGIGAEIDATDVIDILVKGL